MLPRSRNSRGRGREALRHCFLVRRRRGKRAEMRRGLGGGGKRDVALIYPEEEKKKQPRRRRGAAQMGEKKRKGSLPALCRPCNAARERKGGMDGGPSHPLSRISSGKEKGEKGKKDLPIAPLHVEEKRVKGKGAQPSLRPSA